MLHTPVYTDPAYGSLVPDIFSSHSLSWISRAWKSDTYVPLRAPALFRGSPAWYVRTSCTQNWGASQVCLPPSPSDSSLPLLEQSLHLWEHSLGFPAYTPSAPLGTWPLLPMPSWSTPPSSCHSCFATAPYISPLTLFDQSLGHSYACFPCLHRTTWKALLVSVVHHQLLLLACDPWKALALELGLDVPGRILPIFVHTLFFEQLPCQHTSASSWLASSYTSQLCIWKHLSSPNQDFL